MEVMLSILCRGDVEKCVSSPIADEKRNVDEIPHMSAEVSTLRRVRAGSSPVELFQTILCLRGHRRGHGDDLAEQASYLASAIGVLEERLRLTSALPPIGRRFSGQLTECGGERGLRVVTKRCRDH